MENKHVNQAYESLYKAIIEVREIGIEATVKREFKNKCRGIEDVLNVVSDIFLKHKIWYEISESEISRYDNGIFLFKGNFSIVHVSGDRTNVEQYIGQGDASGNKIKGAIHAQTESIKSFLLAKCGIAKTASEEEHQLIRASSQGNYQNKRSQQDFSAAYALLNDFRKEVKESCNNSEHVKNLWKNKYAEKSQSLVKPNDYGHSLGEILTWFDKINPSELKTG